jgi:hypothetical protein
MTPEPGSHRMPTHPRCRAADPRPLAVRPVQAATAVDDLQEAPLAAHMSYDLVPPAWSGMPHDVGAGLGHRKQDVADAAVVNPEANEGVAEHPAHHRDAQGLTWENQAEFNVCGRLPSMEHPRSHPLLSPIGGYRQFILWRLPQTSFGNHELRRSLDEGCGCGRAWLFAAHPRSRAGRPPDLRKLRPAWPELRVRAGSGAAEFTHISCAAASQDDAVRQPWPPDRYKSPS